MDFRFQCSDFRTGSRRAGAGGFTLIEVLVAMAVLAMIVVAMGTVFGQSTAAWDSGVRRVQSLMVGRALTDYFVRETGLAQCDPQDVAGLNFNIPSGGGFGVLKGADPPKRIEYRLTDLFGNTTELAASDPVVAYYPAAESYPRYATVRVSVTTDDKGIAETQEFTGRAFLWNRNRYRFE